MGHLVIEGDWVFQAGPTFHKHMLAGPDPLVVHHMPGERTQDESLHNPAWHRGQADRPVVPRILLPALPVDVHHNGKPPVISELPCKPGLLISNGEWLVKLLCPFPLYSRVDPIRPHRLVSV